MSVDPIYFDPNESLSSVLGILADYPEISLALFVLGVSYSVMVVMSIKMLLNPCLLPVLKYEGWLVAFLSSVGQITGVLWLVEHAGVTHAIKLHIIEEKLYIVLIVYTLYNAALVSLLRYISSELKPKRW